MELSVSPQMRVVALVGLLAALALAGGMLFLTRSQAAGPESELSASELSQALRPVTKARPRPRRRRRARRPPRSRHRSRRPRPLVNKDGVPTAIVDALRRSPSAVVALTARGSQIDRMTLAEAKAGARAAGVPYVQIDVLNAQLGRAIARTFGVVEPPATLIYQRPTALFLKLDGYADSATIAQAAENAKAAAGGS